MMFLNIFLCGTFKCLCVFNTQEEEEEVGVVEEKKTQQYLSRSSAFVFSL